MRKYFVRVPGWAQIVYPKAIWCQTDEKISSPLWTIDDGPHPDSTPRWLEWLDRIGAKAIFFFTGKHAEYYPEIVEQVRSSGHDIGGHGYDHLDGWRTGRVKYVNDVHRSMEILGATVFRPPYGRMTPGQYRELASRYEIMMWSLATWDFERKVSHIDIIGYLKHVRNEDIIVCHDHVEAIDKMSRVFSTNEFTIVQ